MRIVRLAGFTVAALAAVAVFVLLGPDDVERVGPVPGLEGVDEAIAQARATHDENAAGAGDNAELQIVTNGWVARDMLFIVADEIGALTDQVSVVSAQLDTAVTAGEPDDRLAALALVAVITIAFHAATLPYVAATGDRRTAVRAPAPRTSRPADPAEE